MLYLQSLGTNWCRVAGNEGPQSVGETDMELRSTSQTGSLTRRLTRLESEDSQ